MRMAGMKELGDLLQWGVWVVVQKTKGTNIVEKLTQAMESACHRTVFFLYLDIILDNT